MYLGCKVKIPETGGKITVKTINGTPYVYYEYGHTYQKVNNDTFSMIAILR